MTSRPRGEGAAAFARRLILDQLGLVLKNEEGVATGSPRALHDLRVAIRRIRALLRAFRRPLGPRAADALEARLRRLSRRLGPSRDADILLRFLRTNPALRDLRSLPAWEAFLLRLRQAGLRQKRGLRAVLASRRYRALRSDLSRFARGRSAPAPSAPLEALARLVLAKALRRIERRAAVAPAYRPEAVHRLRIACRKGRYLAEFLADALGKPVRELGRRLKRIQDALGDIHDQDVCLARLREQRPPPLPKGARADLRARRVHHVRRFQKAWERTHSPRFRRRLRRILKEE